jgi:hypothetical protein
MTALSASLTQQYSALNTLLSSLQTTSSYLTQAFASLPHRARHLERLTGSRIRRLKFDHATPLHLITEDSLEHSVLSSFARNVEPRGLSHRVSRMGASPNADPHRLVQMLMDAAMSVW